MSNVHDLPARPIHLTQNVISSIKCYYRVTVVGEYLRVVTVTTVIPVCKVMHGRFLCALYFYLSSHQVRIFILVLLPRRGPTLPPAIFRFILLVFLCFNRLL